MFLRPIYVKKNGKRHAYWALVESYRTARGSRQRVVSYLGQLAEEIRLGVKQAAADRKECQQLLWQVEVKPAWGEIDTSRVRVENCREYGGPWLGLELIRQLRRDAWLDQVLPRGQEEIRWSSMALVLVLCRWCHPSSKLQIAEHFYRRSTLPDLLGIPSDQINESRLYRALDSLLPHQEALEVFLKRRMGEFFELQYDLLLYIIILAKLVF